MNLDDILTMPDSQRLKVHFRKRRKRYHCEKRPKFTRDQLLAYLRTNNFRSSHQLMRGRKPGEPKEYEYRREFGTWKNAKLNAFGIPPVPTDPVYIYKTVIEFNLWTGKAYLAARKKRPDIIPSIYFIYKHWGRFKRLTEFARRFSIRVLIESYWKLKRKLGRHPEMDECKAHGIHLEKAIEFFDGKRKMEKFVDALEAQE